MISKSLCILLFGVALLLGVASDNPSHSQKDYFIDVMKEINPKLSTSLCLSILNRIHSDDVSLHLAVMWQESDLKDSMLICDHGRSHGYYQIGLSEAKTIDKTIKRADLLSIRNIELGSQYLDSLVGKYGVVKALRVYNGSYRYSYRVLARKFVIDNGRVFGLSERQVRHLRSLNTMDEAEKFRGQIITKER
jgi:hypothetical protein